MNNDLISRQAAIDVASYECHEFRGLFGRIEERLKALPSAQPERKTGRWIIYVISPFDGEGCKCSECGFEGAPYWDYCPNCGDKMTEVDR